MNRKITYSIAPQAANLTIGEFLQSEGYSRHVITHLKKTEEGILLNGVWAYTSQKLQENDQLVIKLIEETSSESILPVKMNLSILYEDEDILIIDKPANLSIHPSQNHFNDTLANALAYYFKEKNEPFIYRCVNRLDRDTSGLVLLAKNKLSSCILSDQVANREISRTYLAVVEGKTESTGRIDAPIGRKSGSTIERRVDFEYGDHAVTHYKRLFYENGYSLLEVHLETGRTHQIRIHMSYIGHPLPGDYLYNPNYDRINRQALHSYSLTFLHPITKEQLTFTAPLPEDITAIFNKAEIPLLKTDTP